MQPRSSFLCLCRGSTSLSPCRSYVLLGLSPQGDAGDQERLKRQQELTALNLYQLQQLQYQYLLRQQYAQALAQQKAQALSSAPHQQQQQQQQQINLLLQQYQALKMRSAENT